MLNIYCTFDCVHQKEGLCTLEKLEYAPYSLKNECAYYEKKENDNKKTYV